MIKTKQEDSDWKYTGKEIREVWRNFSTLQRRNKLKFDKQRIILQQTQYIIIFDFFYADHCISRPGIATQHNILYLVFLAAIQITSKSLFGRCNHLPSLLSLSFSDTTLLHCTLAKSLSSCIQILFLLRQLFAFFQSCRYLMI